MILKNKIIMCGSCNVWRNVMIIHHHIFCGNFFFVIKSQSAFMFGLFSSKRMPSKNIRPRRRIKGTFYMSNDSCRKSEMRFYEKRKIYVEKTALKW